MEELSMKVLVVGSGGREHALVWKLAQCPGVTKLYAAPGNPGMKSAAQIVPIGVSDLDKIVEFAVREAMDLVIVGPEAPLAEGLADLLRARGILCFGPGAEGALLESSKKYARDFMARHGIPAPSYRAFAALDEARRYIENLPSAGAVVKADGLAQGKGVVVARDKAEALAALDDMMNAHRFGDAGKEVLIEERLAGEEISLLTFTDGKTILPMLPVQDHNRIGEGDIGPNTGGMGAYAPTGAFTPTIAAQVDKTIIQPLQDALRKEKLDYRGCLYIGLMLTPDSSGNLVPKVIEFNARFGDPETQAVLPIIRGDFGASVLAAARGNLTEAPELDSDGNALCVVAASGGYPGHFAKGMPISGLEDDEFGTCVYHSGTDADEDGDIVTSGGRVLSVTGTGPAFDIARSRAYGRIESINFKNMHYRRDIGWSEKS
jgi:phosphoribosylamine--glycine ligase